MNRILIGFVASIAMISLFSLPAFAQSGMVITVKDANGAVVPGASVTIEGTNILARTLQTDTEGKATFPAAMSGNITVSAEAIGFPKVVRSFSFNDSQNIEIVLVPGGISETVTITATRTQISSEEAAVPVSVVDREEIDKKGVNVIGDIFRTLPGTSTVNEGAFQVRPRIRGLDSNRVLILVDGERLNNSRTSTAQSGIETGLVETSQIESVEVVRGSGSVLYGTDAMGGTINIITRDTPARRDGGFRFGGLLDTFYSSNENGRRGNLELNGSNNRFAFRIAQSLERFGNYSTGNPDQQFLDELREQGVSITDQGEVLNSQSHAGNSTAVMRLFLNDNNTIRASYDRRRGADIGSPGLEGVFNGFFPFSNRDKASVKYDSVAINEYLQRVSVSGFYQTQYRNFTNVLTVPPVLPFFPGLYQFSETVTDTKTTGFDLQTDWVLGSRNNLIAGASFFRDNNKDRRTIVTSATASSPNRTVSNTNSVPNADLSNFAGFVQDEFQVNRRLKLVGGFRVDRFSTSADPTPGFALPNLTPDQIEDLGIGNLASGLDVNDTAVTGDLGAVFKLSSNVVLSGRVGRSFRTPNIFELFFTGPGSVSGFVVGNPQLKPETGVNFDTSVKFKWKQFGATATYFNNTYRNLLATVPAVDSEGDFIFLNQPGPPTQVYQTQNIDRARIQGFEAEFEAPVKISLGYLTPYGNISYLRGDNLVEKEPLNFISPLRTNLGALWQNFGKAYFFDYNVRIVGEQDRLSDSFLLTPVNQGGNGGPEPGFVTHNIAGGYHFQRERFVLGINVGVSNLFDRAYSEQFVFAPARGRSFTFGMKIELR